MERAKAWMHKTYALLVLLVGVSVAIYVLFEDRDWVAAWAPEVGGGLGTSLLLLVLIDRRLERQREIERGKVKRVALTLLGKPLRSLLAMFGHWQRVASADTDPIPMSFDDMFGSAALERFRYMNFASPAQVMPEQPWIIYSANRLNNDASVINAVIDKYGANLESEAIETLEGLINANLATIIRLMGASWNVYTKKFPQFSQVLVPFSEDVAPVEEYAQRLAKGLKFYNLGVGPDQQISFESLGIWNAANQAVGSARWVEAPPPDSSS